jgi:two-component system, OmpR family, alkaline phosphatase synthesis response regulator PhoP
MPSEQPLILVVDDDPSLRQLLNWQLTAAGFRIVEAVDGANGLELFDQHQPDLVLLDIMMPMMDGWEVLREMRSRSDVPVLMLTALTNESDQVAGLDGGADDYVVKPFTLRHLLARIRALLRRTGQAVETLVCGPLTLDFKAYEVSMGGHPLPLTRREFELLEVLARHPGRTFSRAELLARCWGPDHDGVDRVVDVHMASLRRKLGRQRKIISTVRGIGYRLKVD